MSNKERRTYFLSQKTLKQLYELHEKEKRSLSVIIEMAVDKRYQESYATE